MQFSCNPVIIKNPILAIIPAPTTGQLPLPSASAKLKLEKTPFKAPKSQELVAFRKNIEKNELDLVRNIIELNPRYLVSSGDMPTILKEGPRYNALHVAAMEGNTDMCRLILATIENPAFIEFLHGQRNASTDEVSAILLDLYLNMPDKCRSETPLHFAAKFGSVGVIEVLISYPQCKLTKNSDGHLPKDVSIWILIVLSSSWCRLKSWVWVKLHRIVKFGKNA